MSEIVDPALPAVTHLTAGASARAVLAAAVGGAGGAIHSCRVVQVQYRPGHDVVVRYRCDVTWADGRRRSETLLAAASESGPLPGAVPVRACTEVGDLEVSVWRWPFDPVLPGLETAVTVDRVQSFLAPPGCSDRARPSLDVVAYRPTERAVVCIRGVEQTAYVKVVAPSTAVGLAHRHRWLRDAGLPVPDVLACDEELGLLALRELPGPTLRDRLKEGSGALPDPDDVLTLISSLGSLLPETAGPSLPRVACRLRDALGHAGLLRAIRPSAAPVLDGIAARIQEQIADGTGATAVVHGDLHEAQVVLTDDGRIAGLLDIDDVGIGDPVTDMATLVAHLRFRAAVAEEPADARRIREYADRLRRAAAAHHGSEKLDVWTAAVLVGLATGPFRIQRPTWCDDLDAVLDDALGLVNGPVHSAAGRT